MEILRVSQNAWGQETLEGISWDLLPIAVGLGVLVIVAHFVYRRVRPKHRRARVRADADKVRTA
jgi:hypothetical protein